MVTLTPERTEADYLTRTRVSKGYLVTKRLGDLAASGLLLLLLSPLLFIITLWIWLDSHGPILVNEPYIRQLPRSSETTQPSQLPTFRLYRFRTTLMPHLVLFRLSDDPQVTRVGQFLRRTSLDELPQLINVFKGDMSLVGPRPLQINTLNQDFREWHAYRLQVKPGLLGWWQVSRRNLGTLNEMVAADLEYIKRRSFWFDLQIILMTPRALLRRTTYQHWLTPSLQYHVREDAIYETLKRVIDVSIGITALILGAPLLLLIALAIRLDSEGPIIYTQLRTGKRVPVITSNGTELRGTSFKIYKFRTMYNRQLENDAIHQQWVKDWKNGKFKSGNLNGEVKPAHDPRVTWVGRFLRETSLDELPQLLNILKGNMSVVGPRPVPIYEVKEYSEWHYHRLDVLPGLTGWWQVKLRGHGTLEQMVELDLEYIRRRSIWFDIRIILQTIPVILSRRGAR